MKKLNLLLAAGFVGAVPALAQTNILTMGFEDGDQAPEASPTEYALTPHVNENNTVSDWVNVKETDNWNDKEAGGHSGEYCFIAENAGAKGYSWDRGLKFGLGKLETKTPYRVSFWVKADPECTYTNDSGESVTEAPELTSWISKGMENFDLAFPDPTNSGNGIGLSAYKAFTGDWQRVSFVTYNPDPAYVKSVVDSRSWVGSGTFPTQFGGAGASYKDTFGGEIPEMYFFIINMYSPATYMIDDITVDQTSVKDVVYGSEIIKIDFGWKNNIAALAKANGGSLRLDPSAVEVLIDGEPADVDFFEGKEDGYLYAFMAEGIEGDEVEVSFKGDDRIFYTSQLRPTAEEGDAVKVLPFSGEKAMQVSDDEVDVEAAAWAAPVVQTSTPENSSFNLIPSDIKTIRVTYFDEIVSKYATATLKRGVKTVQTFGVNDMTLAEDNKTLTFNVTTTDLADGAYTLEIEGVQNTFGGSGEPTVISFELGVGSDSDVAVEAGVLNMKDLGANSLPMGWSGTSDNSDREAKGAASTGLSGAPRIMGDNSKANQGIYWGARGGSAGMLAFGKYAAETSIDGQLAADVTPAEALYLEAGPYLLSYKNASWDTASGNAYSVKVCNAIGEEIFSQAELVPTETVAQGPADGVVTASEYEFEVPEAGYYYVQFDGNTGWACWLLTSFSVSSKPSSPSGYYSKALKDAIAAAETVLNGNPDEKYDGTTKEALAAEIAKQKEAKYTTPSQVEAAVKALNSAADALSARVTDYNDFVNNFASAKDKYANLADKYKNTDVAKATVEAINQYEGVDPKSLSDAELDAAATAVKNLPGLIDNIVNVTGIVTKRAQYAADLAINVGDEESVDALDALFTDDTKTIDNANVRTTAAIYTLLGDDIAALDGLKQASYDTSILDENYDETDPEQQATHDSEGHPLIVNGVNFSGYIKNPNFYTYATDFSVLAENTLPGWTYTALEYTNAAGETATGSMKLTGTAATATNPAVTAVVNGYGASNEYTLVQTIENLPVGQYDFILGTRTGTNSWTPEATDEDPEPEQVSISYNAQDEEGNWDKYIYAKVEGGETYIAPFTGGGGTTGLRTYLRKVQITKPGQKVEIGFVEDYKSGKAQKNGAPTDYWDTNTYVNGAEVYFTAPIDGFDYKKAAEELNGEIATDINDVDTKAAGQNGKYLEDGKIVIVKDGKKFNVAGQEIK